MIQLFPLLFNIFEFLSKNMTKNIKKTRFFVNFYYRSTAPIAEKPKKFLIYGDRDIHVKITIDDYTTDNSDNRAVLKALERL